MVNIQHFFDNDTFTLTYIVSDPDTNDCVIIDPVWNYDQASSTLTETSVNSLVSFIIEKQLHPKAIIETHVHADHVSGAQPLKKTYPEAKTVISGHIKLVQTVFKNIFNFENFDCDGNQFDHLILDGETYQAGSLSIKAIHNPGHTPACTSYLIEDHLFTGDALFMPDSGTGRCDFPEGNAETLYDAITAKIYTLPNETKTYTGHDYQPGGRDLAYCSTIGTHKKENIHLTENTPKENYVDFRNGRDKGLNAPKLLLPSIQINMNGGRLPGPEENGKSYLKLPIS